MESSLLKRFNEHTAEELLFRKKDSTCWLSAGVDSVVLCDLMFRAGIRFALAHVHFGLRGKESDEDQVFAETIAEKYNRPFLPSNLIPPRWLKGEKRGYRKLPETCVING